MGIKTILFLPSIKCRINDRSRYKLPLSERHLCRFTRARFHHLNGERNRCGTGRDIDIGTFFVIFHQATGFVIQRHSDARCCVFRCLVFKVIAIRGIETPPKVTRAELFPLPPSGNPLS